MQIFRFCAMVIFKHLSIWFIRFILFIMAYNGDYSDTDNVPTFSFALPSLTNSENIPNLFSSPQTTKSKRKPGFLTTIQKRTVSNLLEVFRPEDQIQHDEFQYKKRLITNAIHAIYEDKKNVSQNTVKQNQQIKSKKFERSDSYKFVTPIKIGKIKEQSLETTRISSSQPKQLNYSRSEQKFSSQEIQKLRKRAGVK